MEKYKEITIRFFFVLLFGFVFVVMANNMQSLVYNRAPLHWFVDIQEVVVSSVSISDPVQETTVVCTATIGLNAHMVRELVMVDPGGPDIEITTIESIKSLSFAEENAHSLRQMALLPTDNTGEFMVEAGQQYYWNYHITIEMPNGTKRVVARQSNVFDVI